MKPYKALDDFSDDEIIQVFISDCLVAPVDNTVVPEFVLGELFKVYCEQIGSRFPGKTKLAIALRKQYSSTRKDDQVCYRVAIKPNLIQEG
jgi:hypothetical protein